METKTLMTIRAFLLALLLIMVNHSNAQTTGDINDVAKFIKDLQYPQTAGSAAGAIRKGYGISYYKNGDATPMYMVEPYFSHMAAIALLESVPIGTSDIMNNPNIVTVRNWMNWYISKTQLYNPATDYNTKDGSGNYVNPALMVNYFYDINGENETTCPPELNEALYCNQIDAEDSDPALFFIVANKYLQKTGDTGWFTQPGIQNKLEGLGIFLLKYIWTGNNLTIAKRAWQMLYTMDNSEYRAGLLALTNIEATAYNNVYGGSYHSSYSNIGDLMYHLVVAPGYVSTAIKDNGMYPLGTTPTSYLDYKLYKGTTNCDDPGYMSGQNMYAFTPTFWPVVFGVDGDFDSPAADFSRDLINTSMVGWSKPGWTNSAASGSFWDTSVGYFFSMSNQAKYSDLGHEQAISALPNFRPNSEVKGYVADAAFLLLNLLKITGQNPNPSMY